jgi:hypothetical protein
MSEKKYPHTITIKSDGNVLEKQQVISNKVKGIETVTAIQYRYTKSITKMDKTLTLSLDEINTLESKETTIFTY